MSTAVLVHQDVVTSTMVLYWAAFLYHIVPLTLGMVRIFGASPKLFIYESAVLVVGSSYGYFDAKDMLKIGALLSVVTAIILVLVPFVLAAHRHRQLMMRRSSGRRRLLFMRQELYFFVSPCDPVPSVNSITRDTE